MGSSPRVRGKPTKSRARSPCRRLIPACAGKTASCPASVTSCPAHPRVCGENRCCLIPAVPREGSSPRVRGKQMREEVAGIPPGLIPACAGKTWRCTPGPCSAWAHPRVCGENIASTGRESDRAGSSPRVRGKQMRSFSQDIFNGLIPACAGKTSRMERNEFRPRAHPRVCGENSPSKLMRQFGIGSSPRVRGKQLSGN